MKREHTRRVEKAADVQLSELSTFTYFGRLWITQTCSHSLFFPPLFAVHTHMTARFDEVALRWLRQVWKWWKFNADILHCFCCQFALRSKFPIILSDLIDENGTTNRVEGENENELQSLRRKNLISSLSVFFSVYPKLYTIWIFISITIISFSRCFSRRLEEWRRRRDVKTEINLTNENLRLLWHVVINRRWIRVFFVSFSAYNVVVSPSSLTRCCSMSRWLSVDPARRIFMAIRRNLATHSK